MEQTQGRRGLCVSYLQNPACHFEEGKRQEREADSQVTSG